MRKILAFFIALGVFGSVMLSTSAADTMQWISIPVQQVADIPDKKDCTFVYELTAEHDDTPMPKETQNGVYSFEITGSRTYEIKVPVLHAGDYKYEIKQQIIERKDHYIYDTREYSFVLRVINADAGLKAYVFASEKQEGKAPNGLLFTNQYEVDYDDNPAQTGDDQNIALWISLELVSMLFMFLLFFKRHYR